MSDPCVLHCQAAEALVDGNPRGGTARLRAAARLDAIDGQDTDRSAVSEGGDAWPDPASHRPVKSRPQGVPAIDLASLQHGNAGCS